MKNKKLLLLSLLLFISSFSFSGINNVKFEKDGICADTAVVLDTAIAVNDAAIKLLFTTPRTLLPQLPLGTIYVILKITVVLDITGSGYYVNNPNLIFTSKDSTTYGSTDIGYTGVLQSTTDKIVNVIMSSSVAGASQIKDNGKLVLRTTSNPTGGNVSNSALIYIEYIKRVL